MSHDQEDRKVNNQHVIDYLAHKIRVTHSEAVQSQAHISLFYSMLAMQAKAVWLQHQQREHHGL